MAPKNGFIDVDTLQTELVAGGDALERIAAFYNRPLPELHRSQNETRMACQFACGKDGETGDRALSIKTKADGAVFRCFQYGCTVRGNLLQLMFMMKHDQPPSGGRLQGGQFKEMARDLQAIVAGETCDVATTSKSVSDAVPVERVEVEELVNVPLKDSPNERARALVTLDERFVRDIAELPPEASAYVRQRPYLTEEMMERFRIGYLPKDGGSLLRGQFVYPWEDADGNVLTWFGRNLNFETQHQKWKRNGDSAKEPTKFRFVKGFHRGQELFGERQFREGLDAELLHESGVIVVEGPNDVIALHAIGVPALALCTNTITERQVEKLTALAHEWGEGNVTVMLDLDREGENGGKQVVWELAKHVRVRSGWTADLADGRFRGRQPESLTQQEWQEDIVPSWRWKQAV